MTFRKIFLGPGDPFQEQDILKGEHSKKKYTNVLSQTVEF